MRHLAVESMTMLLATHEMGFAREVASKVCFLYGGVVHEEGPPEKIFGAPAQERTRGFLNASSRRGGCRFVALLAFYARVSLFRDVPGAAIRGGDACARSGGGLGATPGGDPQC